MQYIEQQILRLDEQIARHIAPYQKELESWPMATFHPCGWPHVIAVCYVNLPGSHGVPRLKHFGMVLATIYDVAPLWNQGIDGTGQTIAVVGRTNINLDDIRAFRAAYGLPPSDPQVILTAADPGIVSKDDEGEADLDVEWSGAVAKGATIKFVVSPKTNGTDGVVLSALYIVNNNLSPILTMSFGDCEAVSPSGARFFAALWQQAAAQGMSVVVSSGDSGSAGCDRDSAVAAVGGLGVNALASTPYNVRD